MSLVRLHGVTVSGLVIWRIEDICRGRMHLIVLVSLYPLHLHGLSFSSSPEPTHKADDTGDYEQTGNNNSNNGSSWGTTAWRGIVVIVAGLEESRTVSLICTTTCWTILIVTVPITHSLFINWIIIYWFE